MNEQYRVVAVPTPIASFSADLSQVEILQSYERLCEIIHHPMSPQEAIVQAAFARHILGLNDKIASLERQLDRVTSFPSKEGSGD